MELCLNIISLDNQLFNGKVYKVILPGAAGPFMILPRHAPIVSLLTKGKIEYVDDEGSHSLNVTGGVAEYSNGLVTVCII